jgi:acyl carrier protein
MILVEDFLLEVQNQLEVEEALLASTRFKELDSYDSVAALVLITYIDEEFKVSINGDDLRQITTLLDLYELIIDRAKNQ